MDQNGLTVTSVTFNKYEKGAMKAWATVTFNEVMTIEGFKVFGKSGRIWASVPSDKKGEDYFDKVKFPKDWYGRDATNPILEAVVEAFQGENNGASASTNSNNNVASADEPW